MAGSGWWPGPPGSGRRRWHRAWPSWILARSRWAGPAGRAGAASGWPGLALGCGPHYWPWSSRVPGGVRYEPKGRPARVRDHDFPDEKLGKAVPYGVYDLAANTGWVNVGTDGDTAAFAVESIRRWWNAAGPVAYPDATALLITADAGRSNGYRTRAWKTGLAALAAATRLEITCCHFPPGSSTSNKIEHPLFSHSSI